MNVSWETALDGSNFSKLNKYVVSDFQKYPKELAHILDQWPAKFHFEIWWHFLLSEAQNISGKKKKLSAEDLIPQILPSAGKFSRRP